MTKNLERVKIIAILKTLKELHPEQFVPAIKELMEEEDLSQEQAAIDARLELIIDKNFAEYGEVFKALA
jgi:hypothetical protein